MGPEYGLRTELRGHQDAVSSGCLADSLMPNLNSHRLLQVRGLLTWPGRLATASWDKSIKIWEETQGSLSLLERTTLVRACCRNFQGVRTNCLSHAL